MIANRQQNGPHLLQRAGDFPPLTIGGEMAELIRAYDWANSPLGPMDTWPDVLATTVSLMLSCPSPMFLWWGEDLIQFYNDAYRVLIREDRHPQALGQRGEEYWPEIWPVIGPQIRAVMREGRPTFERNCLIPIQRNGKLEDVYWTYSYSPVFDLQGAIRGTLVVCSDTTEEVMAEQRLRKSENRFRRLIEDANVAVVLADLSGKLSYLNPATLKLLGYTGKDVESGQLRLDELTPPEFDARDRQAADELAQFGKASTYEKAYVSKSGTKIPMLVDATRLADMEGEKREVAVFLADLTALRRTEEALMQNEKLAAVGRLASSIAHEINNPLAAVMNLLYLIASDLENDTSAEEVLGRVKIAQNQLARVANITRNTLRFHRQLTNPVMSSKAEILEDVLALFQGRLTYAGVTVEKRYSPVQAALGYTGDLRQVFANFISNAADACPQCGRICVRERIATDWATGRHGSRVTIADTGHGMLKETIQRIFEPFFTTREATGTGLGLWVSAAILEKHGAKIAIRSCQGVKHQGTVFALWFPFDGVKLPAVQAGPSPAETG